jgi:hypothetical protein
LLCLLRFHREGADLEPKLVIVSLFLNSGYCMSQDQ